MGYQAAEKSRQKQGQKGTADSVNIHASSFHMGQNPFSFLDDAVPQVDRGIVSEAKINGMWIMLDGIASRLRDFFSLTPSENEAVLEPNSPTSSNRTANIPSINLENNVSITNGLRVMVGDPTVMRKISSYITIDEEAPESGQLGAEISYELKYLLRKSDREIERVFLLANISRLNSEASNLREASGKDSHKMREIRAEIDSVTQNQASLKARYARTLGEATLSGAA